MGGHGCMGCVEPAFWDTMAPLEKPIAEKSIGAEALTDAVFLGLAAATGIGIAAHAGLSALKRPGQEEEEAAKKKGSAKK
jgi:Ni,Fe-hydrogenase I small subunit